MLCRRSCLEMMKMQSWQNCKSWKLNRFAISLVIFHLNRCIDLPQIALKKDDQKQIIDLPSVPTTEPVRQTVTGQFVHMVRADLLNFAREFRKARKREGERGESCCTSLT